MSQLFDKKYRVPNEMTVSLDFKDVIFCLEDLDAASDIVKRRDGKTGDDDAIIPGGNMLDEIPLAKSLWHYFLESSNEACQELAKLLMEKSDRLKQEAQQSHRVLEVTECLASVRPGLALVTSGNSALRKLGGDAIKSANDKMSNTEQIDNFLGKQAQKMKRMLDSGAEVDDSVVDSLLSTDPVLFPPLGTSTLPKSSSSSNCTDDTYVDNSFSFDQFPLRPPSVDSIDGDDKQKGGKMKIPYTSSWFRSPDALNLSGILNALDGVVDCPGRIVIMSSNHPERLDNALIRPGRIDKKLFLGKMQALDVMEMLEHYFETELNEDQRQRVENVISGCGVELTPAQIEQLTVEHDEVEGMIAVLEDKATLAVRQLLSP